MEHSLEHVQRYYQYFKDALNIFLKECRLALAVRFTDNSYIKSWIIYHLKLFKFNVTVVFEPTRIANTTKISVNKTKKKFTIRILTSPNSG